MDTIADSSAALTAYGKLQYTDMTEEERLEIRLSLLKYLRAGHTGDDEDMGTFYCHDTTGNNQRDLI